MINFRFHIVSLTAVLLALGIGLVLGTTFLDDATVDELRRQLQRLEADLDREGQRTADLRSRVDAFDTEASGLDEQLGARLFDGQLMGQPVLVVAPRGIDDGLVERVTSALGQADAELVGTWWLTDRLVLDDEAEVTELAAALGASTEDVDRLRDDLASQIADVLGLATDGAGSAIPRTVGNAPTSGGLAMPATPAEPELLARLRDADFVEYDVPDGDGDMVRLPADGLRVVVVSGPDTSVPLADALVPMLSDVAAADQPTPFVAVEPSRLAEDNSEGDEPGPRLVDIIRDDDQLARSVSTVDDLERVSGRIATVLALVDARPGDPRVGHYGMADGADALLPPADGAGGEDGE